MKMVVAGDDNNVNNDDSGNGGHMVVQTSATMLSNIKYFHSSKSVRECVFGCLYDKRIQKMLSGLFDVSVPI